MSDLTKARENPKEQLFDEIDRIHAGMLGLEGSSMHMQPMAPQLDRQTGTIWFFTKTDTEIAEAIAPGARAHFCVVGKDHDYHACISGRILLRRDPVKIDEYWNSVIEAWFDGKDDPKLTLLALEMEDAEIWASTGSTLKFGWEIAKANLNPDEEPDVGVKTHVDFTGGPADRLRHMV
ncbi:pyridoxamine 5'-phosphate oxidase family protein [Shinella fusca]|jgi:general stress protein 26|uniref:General stress protein 26 n=1 Tax=Shinella fusca TaxID=544480 RepID=A0A7W7YUX5_9HYPH|nr:pyridoxamine 5'-phosphate oxidase family protein [Shinella fusca]MBB5042833.1 general stress protein 26 [Shinella fusca]